MRDKVFFDSNVVIYALNRATAPKETLAKELLREKLRAGSAVISYQVIQEFINVALKSNHPIDELVDTVRNTLGPMCKVESSAELFERAIEIRARYLIHFYDALIVAAAEAYGCSTLYTEDLQHGMSFGRVRVVNPFF